MAIYVRTDDVSGAVVKWGGSPFDDSAPAGETDATLSSADVTDEILLDTHGPAYCTVSGGRIVADALASAKGARYQELHRRTHELIADGAVYSSVVYMKDESDRVELLTLYNVGVLGADSNAWPVDIVSADRKSVITFSDAAAFLPFYAQVIGTFRHWESSADTIRTAIDDASTVGEVDAVTDSRTSPWGGTETELGMGIQHAGGEVSAAITFAEGVAVSAAGVLTIDFGKTKLNHVMDEDVDSVVFANLPSGAGSFVVRIEQAAGLYSMPAAKDDYPAASEFVGDVVPVAPDADGKALILVVTYINSTAYFSTVGQYNN